MNRRIVEIAFSAMLIILFSPLILLLILITAAYFLKSPIFFQDRIGLNGKIFTLYKLRTIKDSGQIPKLFRFIRDFGIDELPQLINVIIGDMSLIGPRPLPSGYMSYLKKEEQKRHDVKPGITGLAQVSGRNTISWGEKFDLDLFYAENKCTKLDMYILIKTPLALFKENNSSTPLDVLRNKRISNNV